MPYAADSSVGIALIRRGHPFHDIASTSVARHRPVLAGHARFETYARLTGAPTNRLSPGSAAAAIAHNFGEPEWLTVDGAARVYALIADAGIAGGAVYDALVAQAALDRDRTLLTLDRRATRTYQLVGVRYEFLA
jgi:predicted nucleic acid-binding protein